MLIRDAVGMFEISYAPELDPRIQEKIRRRFTRERTALTACGFQELCFYSERFGGASALLYLPVLVFMRLKREVLKVRGRLEASASFVLLSHSNPATIALPFGLGVKLYTSFTDGTLLISGDFRSCVAPVDDSIVKHSSRRTIDEAWTQHVRHVREMEARGRVIVTSLGYERFVEISSQERDGSTCAAPSDFDRSPQPSRGLPG